MALHCERGLVVCLGRVAAQCVYCQRHFCARHGQPEHAVCRGCRRRYARDERNRLAEEREAERREHAFTRNAEGLCGVEDCDQPLYMKCQHCGSQYCPRHLSQHRYSYRVKMPAGTIRRKDTVMLCRACRPHLPGYREDRYWWGEDG